MNGWDQRLRARARREDCPLPRGFEERIQKELNQLPEQDKKGHQKRPLSRVLWLAACLAAGLCLTAAAAALTARYFPGVGAIKSGVKVWRMEEPQEWTQDGWTYRLEAERQGEVIRVHLEQYSTQSLPERDDNESDYGYQMKLFAGDQELETGLDSVLEGWETVADLRASGCYTSYLTDAELEQGFLTEAIVNFVALLGWSPENNQEIMTMDELIREFDYHHISKSPAVFDYTKLKWMNGEYIKAMDFDRFYEMAEPWLKQAIHKDLDLKKIAGMVKTRIEIFPDIVDMVDFFEKLPEYDVSMYAHKKMKTTQESSLEVLSEVLPLLEEQEDYSNDALYAALLSYVEKKGCKNGYVMWPIRTAVSGRQMTPAGATEIMEILGKEESLARIRTGIRMLQDSLHG